MFKEVTEDERRYMWPVEIWVPRSGGKKVKAVMNVEFTPLPQDEQNDLIARGGDVDDDTLWRVLVGWKDGDYQRADGSSLSYSEDNKRTLLLIPYARAGIARAYFNSVNGAREKN